MYSCNILISLCFILGIGNVVFSSDDPNPKLVDCNCNSHYEPSWDSLDTRPIPTWFDEAKIGIFIHWGVFSVPSYHSEWFWADWQDGDQDCSDYMSKRHRPNYPYPDFAHEFTAEFYDAKAWAKLFKKAGAKYVVLTSKHHEGYALWPSKYSFGWNSWDVGPKRDLVGELAQAIRDEELTFGLYHSLYEWYHPLYLSDKKNNYTSNEFIVKKVLPELYELVNNYQPSVIWSDGDWEASDVYFQSTNFLAWLYNESPVKDTVVVNDRWGIGIPCKHGDFYSCQDRYNPKVLQKHKWENAMTIDKTSWGYRRNADLSSYLTSLELIETVAETVSCGGNILINIGPSKDGVINPIFEERLTQLGHWLEINGEAIYATTPWTCQNDTLTEKVWYTSKGDTVYAIVLQWPQNNIIKLKSLRVAFEVDVDVVLLGNEDIQLSYMTDTDYVYIVFPDKSLVKHCQAWTLKVSKKSSS